MSDPVKVTFKKEVFHNNSYMGLVKFGDQEFDDSDLAWDLAIFIQRMEEFARAYGKAVDALMRKHSTTYEDERGQETIGVRRGTKEHQDYLDDLEKLNEQTITLDIPKPVITKRKLSGKLNPALMSMAFPFLDARPEIR